MTCVACSGSINKLMNNEFGAKGMISCSIALLMHKMTVILDAKVWRSEKITADLIGEEVECIGFGCELLASTEITAQSHNYIQRVQNKINDSSDCVSQDSIRIGGGEEGQTITK